MFPTLRLFSRTTYQGSRGSGPGRSGKTSFRSSPHSRPTETLAQQRGQIFKRSQRGLYHGALIQSGNNVPNSRQKTRRTWLPNVHTKNNLWSEVLQKHIKARISTKAMRTIEKFGGLDAYLANTKDVLLGAFGVKLRDQMGAEVRRVWQAQGKTGEPSGKIDFKQGLEAGGSARQPHKARLSFMDQRAMAKPSRIKPSLAERAKLLKLGSSATFYNRRHAALAAAQDISSEARVANARADAAKDQ